MGSKTKFIIGEIQKLTKEELDDLGRILLDKLKLDHFKGLKTRRSIFPHPLHIPGLVTGNNRFLSPILIFGISNLILRLPLRSIESNVSSIEE